MSGDCDLCGTYGHVEGTCPALSTEERLRMWVEWAAADLDSEHHPMWVSDEAKAAGKKPIGCEMCYPADSHWPCTSKMVASDLRQVLRDTEAHDG